MIEDEPGAAWWADPGMGKTLCALELTKRLRKSGKANRTLVIAPLDVCYSTWPTEIQKFGYPWIPRIIHSPTNNTAAFRQRQIKGGPSYLHLINPEGIKWLCDSGSQWDFVIIDESTKFKNWTAVRTEHLVRMCRRGQIGKLITMTGTPKPNGYQDIYAQMWLCDHGKALGSTLTEYRSWALNQMGYGNYSKWGVRQDAIPIIEDHLDGMVMRVDAKDHLDLPHVKRNTVYVDMPDDARRVYDEVEADLLALLENGELLTASNAGVKYGMCRQIANGGVWHKNPFTNERRYQALHEAKVHAIENIVDELQGKPVIVVYQYNHDLDRLRKVFKHAPVIKGGVKADERKKIIARWNRKEIPVLFVQPKALAHGANMQGGGCNMIWCGMTNELELYQQLEQRIWRQGQADECRFHYVLARNTIEDDIMDGLMEKSDSQADLMERMKRRSVNRGHHLVAN